MSLWLKWTRDQDLLKAFLCLFAHCTDLALSLVNKWILNVWKSWKVFLYLGCPSVYRGVHPQGHNYSNFFSFYSPNILKKFSSYILYILYLDIDSSFRWLNYPTFFLSNNKVSFSLNLSLNSAIFLCLWLKQSSINSSPLPAFPLLSPSLSASNRTVNDGARYRICHCFRAGGTRQRLRENLGVLHVSVLFKDKLLNCWPICLAS